MSVPSLLSPRQCGSIAGLVLGCAVLTAGCRSPAVAPAPLVVTTEEKIAMIAGVLEARDRGEFEQARARLAALIQLAPNDAAVLQLGRQLDRAIAAAASPGGGSQPAVFPADIRPAGPVAAGRGSGSANAPSIPPAPSTAPVVTSPPPAGTPRSGPAAATSSAGTASGRSAPSSPMPPVIVEPATDAPPPGPPDLLALAQARVEATGSAFALAPGEIDKLMDYLDAQRALARLYSERGQNLLAAHTIDSMLASLRLNVALYVGELKSERSDFILKELDSREGVRIRHRR